MMKLVWVYTILATGCATKAHGQSTASSLVVPPNCGLQCLVELISSSVCSITDQACVCTNQELVGSIAACVSANCTIRESLTMKEFSYQTCGYLTEDNSKAISIPGLVGGGLAILAFVLRMAARLPATGGCKFGMDDLTMCLAMILLIPLSALSYVLASNGLGLDMWFVPFDNITFILKIFFIDELLYLSILPLVKISILFFYLRVFPKKNFRVMVHIVMACTTLYGLVFVSISIFQCRPLYGAWTRWDGTFQGQCNNINLQGWTSAAINIVLDVLVLSLSLPELSKLVLPAKRKLGVILMFCVGFIITAISVLRLQSLLQFANTQNVTQDYVALGYWSTTEVQAGVICACMPAIRSLFRAIFPGGLTLSQPGKVFGATSSSGRGDSYAKSLTFNSVKPKTDATEFVELTDLESGHIDTGDRESS